MPTGSVSFAVMDRHSDAPRPPGTGGKVVLSRLPRGRSAIAAPAASLKLVLEGEEVYEVDGQMHRVRAGQFLYLDAGSDCTAHIAQPTRGLCLLLPPQGSSAVHEHDPLIGRAMTLSTRTSQMGAVIAHYAQRIAADPGQGERLATGLVGEAARHIASPLADIREAVARLKGSKPRTRRAIYERLDLARAYLHEHQHEKVALPRLAEVSGISQFQLARYFHLAFGQSPIAYHRTLRLKRAASLLKEGEGCLERVAEQCGYSDQVALTHAFTRTFGAPPKRWLESVARPS